MRPPPALQQPAELEQLLELYRAEAPLSLLEVGVAEGGTLYHWLREARRDLPVTVVAIDEQLRDEARFRSWAPATVDLHLLQGRSEDPAVLARAIGILPRFDWVYIDADHALEAARHDWQSFGALGRTVVLHDITPASAYPEIEVWRLWQELLEQGWPTAEIVEPGASWGGFGIVRRG